MELESGRCDYLFAVTRRPLQVGGRLGIRLNFWAPAGAPGAEAAAAAARLGRAV